MPPILSILGVDDLHKDSLDFGTVIVYTCRDSVSSLAVNLSLSKD